MGYRDEDAATHARNAALQDEVAALKAENEALKAAAEAAKPVMKPTKRQQRCARIEAAQAEQEPRPKAYHWSPPTAPNRAVAFQVGVPFLLMGSNMALCVFHGMPDGAAAFIGIGAAMVGGAAVGMTAYQAINLSAPIIERSEHGEPFTVERSPRMRRTLAAIALGVYLFGTIVCLAFGGK